METENIQQKITALLQSQKLAVLATQGNERPYTSLVALSYTEDLKHIFFVTSRATRKYDNLMHHPQIALLADNRKNTGDDFLNAVAVTIIGTTEDVDKTTHQSEINTFLQRHTHLSEFVMKDSTAFCAVHVSSYVYVCNFGDVTEYIP